MWGVIRELVADGATLLLTTQYLDEADELADRIVVVDHGRAIAERHGRRAEGPDGRRPARGHADPARPGRRPTRSTPFVERRRAREPRRPPPARAGPQRRRASRRRSCARSTTPASTSTTSQVHQPSLDDVFFALTGHAVEADDAQPAASRRPARQRDPLVSGSARRRRAHRAQPRPHRPRAAAALRRDGPAACSSPLLFVYVFGAGSRAAGRRQLHRLRDRRPAGAEPDDLVDGDGRRAQHRPLDRRDRPLPDAADVAAGRARRPLARRPADGRALHRDRGADRPCDRLAAGRRRRSRRSPGSASSCSSATRCRGAAPASASSARGRSRPRAWGS